MTTDLEKQFFNTFNIEPIECNDNKNCTGALDCTQCPNAKYPQITDRILLNLILIMNPYAPPVGDTMEEMKEQVLFWCINVADNIKHQVQTLFKEER